MLSFPGFLVHLQSFFKSKPILALALLMSGGVRWKGGVGQMPLVTPGSGSGATASSVLSPSPACTPKRGLLSGSNWH